MLIAQIVGILISVLVPIVFCVLKKFYKPPEYEISVNGGISTILMCISLDVGGILFIVFSMYSSSSGIIAQILFYVFGMLLGIIPSVMGFYDVLFNYTAFCNDKIILKRFFCIKELHISEIDKITCFKGYISFYKKPKKNKYYKKLFEISANATDAAELVHTIDERRVALNLNATETNE